MTDNSPDFGGIWVRDMSEVFEENDPLPGVSYTFPVFVFYRGGHMFRLKCTIDPSAEKPEEIELKGFSYLVDDDLLCMNGNFSEDASLGEDDIIEFEWRYENNALEIYLENEERWSRWIWITEDDAMSLLKLPREFFDGLRKGATAGGFTYVDHAIVPGHLPK